MVGYRMAYQFDRLKVLIVDDNAHMRKLVSTIMEAFGIEPDEDDDVDTLIKDAIAANGDGMSYITIFDTETNQQIVG